MAKNVFSAVADFLRRSGPGRVGFALSMLLLLVAITAPWIAPYSPTAQNLPARLVAPTAQHWMGTDELGRDILSRIIFGTRVSMMVSVCVVFGAGIIGLAVGAHMMHMPPRWIGVGVLVLGGLGILKAVASTRQRDPN